MSGVDQGINNSECAIQVDIQINLFDDPAIKKKIQANIVLN